VKTLLVVLALILSTGVLAQSRGEAERLLQERGMSLTALEAQGNALMFGENTGHGRKIQFSEVQVILTRDQAVLKREIESASFNNGQQTLDKLESLRFGGQYILKSDVAGVIIKK
jgi:hypothetical protein